ncbi:metal ABC transporter permease [Pseudovibrio denitrificans]|uniref:Metal ABC transporter permease n=1 Tax=Pseudovibrio brasiliensis TaxID=1898042 RepID=A0ABX8AQJ4_9HYPH|nr:MULTISPECIES: metal ABC transporter permease [Pseudovibrio]EEA94317.1 ABC-3 protein [Pseudovibrio sp. JE062]QUS56985.1 metal ABC transporter permease [Pseudovibrio brasiliensis]
MDIFLQFDLPSILLGSLAALACGLLGNFLVLRKQALMGDAISHVVLPGIVLGFLFSHETGSWAMMIGAGVAAIFAVLLIELIRRIGNVEPGAAMGVVFTTMFAAGVVILEQTGTAGVHLDVEHALYGNLESAIWLDAYTLSDLWNWQALSTLPESIKQLFIVNLLVIGFIVLFFKELKISSFDPLLSASLGFSPKWLGLSLIVMVAIAAVAAFSAVGSILVIAMFICPAATARMLTDNLKTQLFISGIASLSAGLFGYLLAAFGPGLLGYEFSVSAAGMIAVVAGLQQVLAMLFAPHYGVVMRRRRQREHVSA